MIGQQYAPTRTTKVSVVEKTQFQNSKTCIGHYRSKKYPNKLWLRKIAQEYSQRKEMQTWIMPLREDQIFS